MAPEAVFDSDYTPSHVFSLSVSSLKPPWSQIPDLRRERLGAHSAECFSLFCLCVLLVVIKHQLVLLCDRVLGWKGSLATLQKQQKGPWTPGVKEQMQLREQACLWHRCHGNWEDVGTTVPLPQRTSQGRRHNDSTG